MNYITTNHSTTTVVDTTIMGNHNKIYGNNNVIKGDHNKIYGNGNIAHGNHNRLYGQNKAMIKGKSLIKKLEEILTTILDRIFIH